MAVKSICTVRLTYARGESGPTSILGVPIDDCEALVNRHLALASGEKVSSDLMIWSYAITGRDKDKRAENGKQVLVRLNNITFIEVGASASVKN